jgi:hypothetical protein
VKHYSKEGKDAVIKRMMQPENAPVPMLAEETGISRVMHLLQISPRKRRDRYSWHANWPQSITENMGYPELLLGGEQLAA